MRVMIMIVYMKFYPHKKIENQKDNTFLGQYKDMYENPNFEQDYSIRTTIGFYKIGYDSIRLMKWLAYYDRSYYVNIN